MAEISIHAAREGGDALSVSPSVISAIFQSTPPVKAATGAEQVNDTVKQFQSTPPVKAATVTPLGVVYLYLGISIHAAREGGDSCARRNLHSRIISIHAAREGGDGIAFSS